MNLLKVQDALKNASDQQLMALMQAPDSTAPSYLVLSEIRRRKEMRSQQAPEGQPNRTVADELLAQDDGGIRDIVAHDEPEAQDGAEEMAAGGLASLRRYAEGGVVRMQAGGQSPLPLSDLRDEDLLSYYDYFMGQQRPLTQAQVRSGRIGGVAARNPAVSSPYDFISIANEVDRRGGITPPQMFSPQNEGAALRPATRSEDIYRSVSSLPSFVGEEAEPGYMPPPPDADRDAAMGRVTAAPTTRTTTQPGGREQPPPGQRPSAKPPAAQPPAARPAAAQPAPAPAARPQGIEALRPGSTEGAEQPQSSVQFADRLSPLFARMQEGRVDPAARRNEAMNMALIEAGLRIASSRNPSLAGAIGEGAAPAVQAYSQQLGQIRQDQRQDLRDELQGALAQNQNDYYRGRLSQQEFATRQQLIIERMRQTGEDRRTGQREEGANARNAATIAAGNRPPDAARLFHAAMGRDPRPGNQEDLAILYRLNERYDPARTTVPAENRAEIARNNAYARDPTIQALAARLQSVSTMPGPEGDRMRSMIRQQIEDAERRLEERLARGATAPLTPGPGGALSYTGPGSR
jgi:hypothetical protein